MLTAGHETPYTVRKIQTTYFERKTYEIEYKL